MKRIVSIQSVDIPTNIKIFKIFKRGKISSCVVFLGLYLKFPDNSTILVHSKLELNTIDKFYFSLD